MKKILIIGIIILGVFLIYLTTIDKKVYYLALGDEIALGMTNTGKYEQGYTDYIKKYLEEKNKLEIYVNDYATINYRITDLINDIEKNKQIENDTKTIKNALIKSDLLTISIGTNDILSQIDNMNKLTKIDYQKLTKNIDEIVVDLNKLLNLIREYCKEDIIMIGIYIEPNNETLTQILEYANQQFKITCNKYDISYIDTYNIINKQKPLNIYPSKEEYKEISNQIITIINDNLLN